MELKRTKSSKSMAGEDDPGWFKPKFIYCLVVHTPRNREMQLDDGRLSLGSPGMGAVTKNYSTPPLASKKLNNMKIILRTTKRKISNDIYIYTSEITSLFCYQASNGSWEHLVASWMEIVTLMSKLGCREEYAQQVK